MSIVKFDFLQKRTTITTSSMLIFHVDAVSLTAKRDLSEWSTGLANFWRQATTPRPQLFADICVEDRPAALTRIANTVTALMLSRELLVLDGEVMPSNLKRARQPSTARLPHQAEQLHTKRGDGDG